MSENIPQPSSQIQVFQITRLLRVINRCVFFPPRIIVCDVKIMLMQSFFFLIVSHLFSFPSKLVNVLNIVQLSHSYFGIPLSIVFVFGPQYIFIQLDRCILFQQQRRKMSKICLQSVSPVLGSCRQNYMSSDTRNIWVICHYFGT